MGWIIAATVIVFIAALLMLRIGVRIRYTEDRGLSAVVAVFGIPLKKLYPERPKAEKINLRDYTPRAVRKRAEKLSKQKRRKKSKTVDSAGHSIKKQTFSDKLELVKRITAIALKLIERFAESLRTDVKVLQIYVSAEDAADTALMYGAVSQAVAYLTELIENKTDVRYARNARTGVYSDFLSGKPYAEADITFSMRLWQIISLAVRAVIMFLS